MFNLIMIEFKKIFKKKSVYITTGILIGLICLATVIIKLQFEDNIEDSTFSEANINYLTNTLQSLNPNNKDDIEMFISIKSELEFIDFAKQYPEDSWQRIIINDEGYELIQSVIIEKYRNKDNIALASAEAELEELKTKLDKDDWKSFVNEKKLLYENEIRNIEEAIKLETNKNTLMSLKNDLEEAKIHLFVVEYRLENDINFTNSYLNNALNNYENAKTIELNYNPDNMSDEEELEYKQYKKEEHINKYILDNKVDIDSYKSARNIYLTVIEDNIFLFIIFIIMIAGSIVSEEFNKGTIKMILVRPYKRWKILTSKYLSCLIALFYIIIITMISQFLIGGIVFGFSSYGIPAIVYDYAKDCIIEMPILKYQIIMLCASLPQMLLIMTLAFTISTVFTSTSIALTVSYLVTLFSSIVNDLITMSNLKIFRFFPTMCWDLTQFLFGNKPKFKYLNLRTSITMDIIYLGILIFINYFVFNRKNVKNI